MTIRHDSNLSAKHRVLIVDSDAEFTGPLKDYLEGNGFAVTIEANGAFAIDRIRDQKPDVVILELNVPGENGLTICKLSRRHFSGPIVMVSDRVDELDQVLCLDMGADDFINKPVTNRVMLARVQAQVRRLTNHSVVEVDSKDRLEFGDLIIDNTMREAWLNNSPIDLTSAEFDLLWLLSSHAGQIMTREEIFHQLRGIEYDGQDRSVDVRVSRIRPKVGDDPIHPRRIKTVRSKGYLFVGELPTSTDVRSLN